MELPNDENIRLPVSKAGLMPVEFPPAVAGVSFSGRAKAFNVC
jgi:hypothetical protein